MENKKTSEKCKFILHVVESVTVITDHVMRKSIRTSLKIEEKFSVWATMKINFLTVLYILAKLQ